MMCAYITITEVASLLTPIVIGAAVVYIAWQQHQTNKNRLKMELFDRRYKVYDAVITVLTEDFDKYNDDMWLDLHRDLSATRFLFNSDQDVIGFQGKVICAVNAIVKFRREHSVPLDEKETQAAQNLLDNLRELRQEAIDVFSKYLTLDA